MACLHPELVLDNGMRLEMYKLFDGYESPADYFVSKLAQGIGTIAAAFYPRPVCYNTLFLTHSIDNHMLSSSYYLLSLLLHSLSHSLSLYHSLSLSLSRSLH